MWLCEPQSILLTSSPRGTLSHLSPYITASWQRLNRPPHRVTQSLFLSTDASLHSTSSPPFFPLRKTCQRQVICFIVHTKCNVHSMSTCSDYSKSEEVLKSSHKTAAVVGGSRGCRRDCHQSVLDISSSKRQHTKKYLLSSRFCNAAYALCANVLLNLILSSTW